MPGFIRKAAALLCVLWLALPAAFTSDAARAEEAPTGAILATVTVKPWLRPLSSPGATPAATPTAASSPDAASSLNETENTSAADWTGPTSPPSSLSDAEAVASPAPTAVPTAAPTPTPEDVTLPGVLGLSDAHVFRMLLIGTDAYTMKAVGRSDTMIVLQVNTLTGEIRMVSFLRDLYVQIPGHGRARLNAAYVYGGAELLKKTLSRSFGVSVDRTLAVNFSLMAELIDRIGGVTVDVSERERRQLNSILKFYNTENGYKQKDQLLTESGEQTLTGKQALCYSRIRKIDSDFARTARQRKVIEAIYARVRELDPLALVQLVADTLSQVKTDLTLTDAVALVPVLMRLDEVQFLETTVPTAGSYHNETIAGMSVLVPDLDKAREAVAAFLR